MRQFLTVATRVLGGLVVAAVLAAVLAAPGFLSDSASTVEPTDVAAVAAR